MAKKKAPRKKAAAKQKKSPASKVVGEASAAARIKAKDAIAPVLVEWSTGIRILERWTVDRIDEEAEVVRVERIRMPQKVLEKVVKDSEVASSLFEKDDLDVWKEGAETSDAMTKNEFLKNLSFQLKDKETLTENMVFLVLMNARGKVLAVYHITQAARALSRDLYEAVIGA